MKITHLKHSSSSGSFNKLKGFEKPLLKNTRAKQPRQFMVERKQINLQNSGGEDSRSRADPLRKSKTKLTKLPLQKVNNTQLVRPGLSSRTLKSSTNLSRNLSNMYLLNSSSTLLLNSSSETAVKPKRIQKDASTKLLQRIGKKHFSNLNRVTPEIYKKHLTHSFYPALSLRGPPQLGKAKPKEK